MRFTSAFSKACLYAVAAALPALALTAGGPAAAAPSPGSDRATAGTDAVLSALQRDLGLSADQAKQLSQKQAGAVAVDKSLRQSLGTAFGGSTFDARSGKLTVSVTDAKRTQEVAAKGANVRVVAHGQAKLNSIVADLDALTGKAKGTNRAKSTGKLPASLAGVVSWQADPTTDSVVVTLLKGAAKPAVLAGYGDAVTIRYTSAAPQAAYNFLDGGDAIYVPAGRCSAGFNLRNPSTGVGYLLTAGHCAVGGGSVYGSDGTFIGPIVAAFFPTYDDALIRNDNPGYWIQGPWVDYQPSNGPVISVNSYTNAPVGTVICKSGSTTGWTCGYITAVGVTVTLGTGQVIYNEKKHSACVEPGDSGGSNVSVTSAYAAEGVTSAALLYGGRCGQVYGYPNESYYYPFYDSIAYYGAVYGVQLW